ncbi:MAG: response regulator [Leptolyngbya sp. SIO4C1]|nr:response regulator [Leptolyngbya sp. SIO4C1]
MRVLLVEDDDALVALLSQQLTAQHYIVDRVADGETGWAYASTFDYDLIILDWMLPQLSGIHLCQRLRQQGYSTPILLLTARNEQTDKVSGLEAGADDYVVKPFDIAELLARIRVLLRRTLVDSAPILTWGELCLDPVSCEVTYRGKPVTLTAKEYSLLELFLRHSHQVFSANALLDRIWSSEDFPSEATVRSHIRGLRRRLKAVGAPADLIETMHGLGYRLNAQASGSSSEQAAVQAAHSDRQLRYLAGLTQAWQAHKGENLERWRYLVHIAQILPKQRLNEQQQSQVEQTLHSLAGTLGTFGLIEGYHLVQQMRQLLQSDIALSSAEISQFQTLATTLGHALDEPPQLIELSERPPYSPTVLVLDVNQMPYVHQLVALAVAQGLQTTVAASIEAAAQRLLLSSSVQTNSADAADLPDLVLVNLAAGEIDPVLDEPILQQLLQFIARLSDRWPQLPVLVVTPQADFGNRLALIRRGGATVLEYPVVPAEVLEVVTQMIHHRYHLSKIMIVDDDAHYLQQIMQLLQPWNFQITPLANPQRFWTLFAQVLPDLLILDIEMPHINGFELCQVLRSNPQWQQLPIVFLSIHSDRAKQAQAFALGADDYITKPIHAQDLAQRLLNRLRRYQAQWQSV